MFVCVSCVSSEKILSFFSSVDDYMTALLPAQKEFVQSPPQGFCERRRNFFDFKRFVENLYFFLQKGGNFGMVVENGEGELCVCVCRGWFLVCLMDNVVTRFCTR